MKKLMSLTLMITLAGLTMGPRTAEARCTAWKVFGTGKALPAIKFNKLPRSAAEFIKMTKGLSQKPEGGAAAMLLALLVYSKNQTLGIKLVTIAIDPAIRSKSCRKGSYKGFCPRPIDQQRLKMRLAGRNGYKIRSYFKGAEPENGYKVTAPYTVRFHDNPYTRSSDGKKMRLLAFTCGASQTRPMTVVKTPYGWKAKEWSSMTSGVRRPAKAASGGAF
jgi:hypothetical protein